MLQQFEIRFNRFVFCLATVFAISFVPARAQDTLSRKHLPDSLYVEKFDDWFVIKPSIVTSAEALVTKTSNFNLILQPNTSEILRTYFSYQFISFYFDYLPHSFLANHDDTEKGKTKLFTIGTSINSHQWFAELNYTKTQGYYVENTSDFRPNWRNGDPYLQFPDLHVTSYDATVGYNTNSKLSLPAAISQTEPQLKSAGAFLPKVVLRYYIVDDRSPASATNEKSNNVQGLLGAGYQYTCVLKKSVYLVGAFTPAFGYIHTSVRQGKAENAMKFTQRGPIYQWDGKFGAGYNGERFFAGTYFTAVSAKYSQGLTTSQNQNANVFVQLFVGFRLKAPKVISNTYNKIFH